MQQYNAFFFLYHISIVIIKYFLCFKIIVGGFAPKITTRMGFLHHRPKIWNLLPIDVINTQEMTIFKRS